MNQLMKIDNINIRQDEEGRYSLNDLHKASGGLAKNQPARFIRNDKTRELIAEIGHYPKMGSGLRVINGGSNRGTYVCKELVYAYAMWVNPKFHLKVIRTFDQVATGSYSTVPVAKKSPNMKLHVAVIDDANMQDRIHEIKNMLNAMTVMLNMYNRYLELEKFDGINTILRTTGFEIYEQITDLVKQKPQLKELYS